MSVKAIEPKKHKPCPFCGSVALKVFGYCEGSEDEEHYVQCQTCTTCGPSGETEEQATGLWDVRN